MLSHRFILTTLSKCFTCSAEGKPQSDFFSFRVIKYLIEHNMLYDNAVEGGIIKALVALNNWVRIFGRNIGIVFSDRKGIMFMHDELFICLYI